MATLQLLLLRHGEAEDARGRGDRGRALTRRGTADAATLGQSLATSGLTPALIVTSDARRAKETAAQIAESFAGKVAVSIEPRLYLCSLKDIAAVMKDYVASTQPVVILVGHNPGFSLAAEVLSDSDLELSTAEAADLTIEADTWDEALQMTGAWELRRIWR